jgi:NitT/TauT family transport system permease protein
MVSKAAEPEATEATGAPPAVSPRQAAPRRRRLRVPTELLLSLGILIVFLGAWELFIRVRGLSKLVLPGPLVIWNSFVDNMVSGFFWVHIQITLSEILLGFALGALIGMGLGTIVAQSPLLNRVINPYIIASQAMPKLALAPIFVLWFGFGITPKIFITALIAFFPLFENTITGLNQVDADRLELFRVLRASRWQTFTKLRLPNALPFIFAGLRVAMVLSIVGAIVGEYVGANRGLGALIIASQGTMDTPLMFAVFLLLTVMGVVLYKLVELAEHLVTGWRFR